ncbi:uncharacterized protein CLUP02_06388 [Colletotrichum lupini]|uniref:Uncharacterized protein n=1 Tax=Colletotrichum lupini TaxID=145971 RepID=A0A9Q8WEL5_9PEZI|nr:uncharacterized protein CLUP02_06388 [Colletotrichum lupini]KAK1703553.1 hypothetical protein BDP67DRAFT_535515 [Colletotrichum lupini]UQC80903.1 hypothetical protein CLUP02_06388 [Colletotrichum lupini]
MKLDSGAGLAAAAAVPLRLALLGGIFLSVPSFLLHLLLPTACDATLQWEKNGSECRSSKIPMAPETLKLAVGGGNYARLRRYMEGSDEAIRT